MTDRICNLINDLGINPVQQSREDGFAGLPYDVNDDRRDDKAHKKRRARSANKINRYVSSSEKTRLNGRGTAGGKTGQEETICQRTTEVRLPCGRNPRRVIRIERMCGHIEDSAFTDLRLCRRRENQIDFKVLGLMERLRSQMEWTLDLFVRNGSVMMV